MLSGGSHHSVVQPRVWIWKPRHSLGQCVCSLFAETQLLLLQPPLITLSRTLRDLPLDWVVGAVVVDATGGLISKPKPRDPRGVKTAVSKKGSAWFQTWMVRWISFWAAAAIVCSLTSWVTKRRQKAKEKDERCSDEWKDDDSNDLVAIAVDVSHVVSCPPRSACGSPNRRRKSIFDGDGRTLDNRDEISPQPIF